MRRPAQIINNPKKIIVYLARISKACAGLVNYSIIKPKKGKLTAAHRSTILSLLPSGSGEVQQELAV
jgi:hypothetical protein